MTEACPASQGKERRGGVYKAILGKRQHHQKKTLTKRRIPRTLYGVAESEAGFPRIPTDPSSQLRLFPPDRSRRRERHQW